MFNGFDRISDLLHTTDITILLATLRLALRLAPQYSSYNSSLSLRKHGQLEVLLELQEPAWQFYRKVDKATTDAAAATSDDKPKSANYMMDLEAADPTASTRAAVSTPAPPRRTASFAPRLQTPIRETAPSSSALLPNIPSTPAAGTTSSSDNPQEGLMTLRLPNLRTSTKSTVDILLGSTEAHQVPEADRLDHLLRIRIGQALCSTDSTERHRLLIIVELVHPEKDVPVEIKSVALYALEAFAHYKGKTAEVASALDARVSHGVLMELVRKTAADLDTAELESTAEFIDALFNILTYINVHQAIGQMVIGAGVVNVLLDLVKISSRGNLQMVAADKAIVILDLDGLLYGYTNVFTAFTAANGLEAFIGRVKSEVDGACEEHREEAEKLEVAVTVPSSFRPQEHPRLAVALSLDSPPPERRVARGRSWVHATAHERPALPRAVPAPESSLQLWFGEGEDGGMRVTESR
ncbi:hypothetical protein C6P46_004040 [Rhodotorula mucilaginosa]|uniref:Uncharacterized protein n=1 Tax=Rhodotorula mucilaginosa TaxID=5537 RepID=A0A9P7B5U6_RHOMI|nr:hypothetical protein C6P46_004040 [Rhodotorula mucilaginosa]